MATTPQAVWFTGGTPAEVKRSVRKTMQQAKGERRVPVLVAYNVPFRDCGQYSAGGALDTAAYEAWIDGFAAGIGDDPAVVILEPDALGIIPYNTTIYGAADWCKPTVTDADGNVTPAPGASPDERYAQLNYAVDAIEAKAARAIVYLDGTHSAWLGVGEAAYRLVKAGVQRAQGFLLERLELPAERSARAVRHLGLRLHHRGDGVEPTGPPATSTGARASTTRHLGFAVNYAPEYAATVTAALVNMMGGAAATTHFVDRHEPQRPGAVAPDRHLSRRAGLVQPARPRRRAAPHREHRRAARRRGSLDQDPRRVRRLVQPRHQRRDRGPRVGRHRRPGRRGLVPAAGARAGEAGESAPALTPRRSNPLGLGPGDSRCRHLR